MSSNDLPGRLGINRHDVRRLDVAGLVPCYNEEHAIAKVVADFHAALSAAAVYAYDYNSTDGVLASAGSASKLSDLAGRACTRPARGEAHGLSDRVRGRREMAKGLIDARACSH